MVGKLGDSPTTRKIGLPPSHRFLVTYNQLKTKHKYKKACFNDRNVCKNTYKNSLQICIKGTFMQIWKSRYMFVII